MADISPLLPTLHMRTRLLLTLPILFTVATASNAKDCEADANNMAEVRECIAEERAQRLAATFERTWSLVNAHNAHAAQLLMAAQNSWQQFATDSCEYTVAAKPTDHLANDSRAACWQAFTDARIRVLQAYQKEFGKTP